METQKNAIDGVSPKSNITLKLAKSDRTLRSRRTSGATKEKTGKTNVTKTGFSTRETPASSKTVEIVGEMLSTELSCSATKEAPNGVLIKHEGDGPQISDQEVILTNKYDSQQSQACAETSAAAEPGTPTTSSEVGDTLESNTNHFTRSKRSSRVNVKSIQKSAGTKRKSDCQETDEPPLPNINEYADILARIDKESYNQDILQDASKILEGNVFPMCFPWQHPVVPLIKNIARDIDEMYPVLHCQDETYAPFENGSFDYGKFEIGDQTNYMTPKSMRKRLKPTKQRAASRRGYDPGTLELTVMEHPHMFLESSPLLPRENNNLSRDLATEGDQTLSSSTINSKIHIDDAASKEDGRFLHPMDVEDINYQSFQETQREKKRKRDLAKAYTYKKMVSVRVASVCTRSSVFLSYDSKIGNRIIFAQAQMPLEVATGKHVTLESAARLDREGLRSYLGSYDVRFGINTAKSADANKETNRSGRAKRTYVGRNRLVWTNKILDTGPGSGSQRHFYSSLLTGARLESANLYKRPRDVRVGIKLNGALLTSDENTEVSLHASDKEGRYDESGSTNSPQIGQEVANAIERVCGQISFGKSVSAEETRKAMCTLDCDKYLRDLFNDKQRYSGGLMKSSVKAHQVVLEPSCSKSLPGTKNDGLIKCKPPRIESLPLSEGSMRVLCCSPGSIEASFIGSFLNQESRKSVEHLCSICWSREDKNKNLHMNECFECGLIAHISCCFDLGTTFKHEGSNKWRCAVCSHKLGKENPGSASNSSWQGRKNRRTAKVPIRFQSETSPDVSQKKPPNYLSVQHSHRCAKCPYSGGAMGQMEMDDGTHSWVHDVCRIWNSDTENTFEQEDVDNHSVLRKFAQVCALCGMGDSTTTDTVHQLDCSNSLVQCAARGCWIKFHPMCALLSSRIHNANKPNNADFTMDKTGQLKSDDTHLCSQYTLTFIRCNRIEGSIGNSSGRAIESLVPVAFCGIHNPNRRDDFFGCPPAGKNFTTNMRIPHKHP